MIHIAASSAGHLMLDTGGSERGVEIPWTLAHLRYHGSLLDVGCAESGLIEHLHTVGLHKELWGVDIREVPLPPGTQFRLGDVRTADLPKGKFDEITCVSTIEHIGLKGAYGCETTDDAAPREALERMVKLCKLGGHVLLTTHYGKAKDSVYWFRVYDKPRLEALLAGFKVKEIKYFRKMESEGYNWREVEEPVAAESNSRHPDGAPGIVGWVWGLVCVEIIP